MQLTKKLFLILGAVALVAISVATSYAIGYRQASIDHAKSVAAGNLYQAAFIQQKISSGKAEEIQRCMDIFLLTSVRNYQYLCADAANQNKTSLYQYASKKADEIDRTLVPVGSKITFTPVDPTKPAH